MFSALKSIVMATIVHEILQAFYSSSIHLKVSTYEMLQKTFSVMWNLHFTFPIEKTLNQAAFN